MTVCRTGYTGEHGYELLPAGRRRGRVVGRAARRGAGRWAGMPCGLGARDTLRTEMGYPLHGQDLSIAVTPVAGEAGLGGRLVEAAVLGARRADPASARSARRDCCGGCAAQDRGIPRPHMPVRSVDDTDLGEVTSGTFSPTLRTGIALALLSRVGQRGRRGAWSTSGASRRR